MTANARHATTIARSLRLTECRLHSVPKVAETIPAQHTGQVWHYAIILALTLVTHTARAGLTPSGFTSGTKARQPCGLGMVATITGDTVLPPPWSCHPRQPTRPSTRGVLVKLAVCPSITNLAETTRVAAAVPACLPTRLTSPPIPTSLVFTRLGVPGNNRTARLEKQKAFNRGLIDPWLREQIRQPFFIGPIHMARQSLWGGLQGSKAVSRAVMFAL